jgi:hypothetical protein
LQVHPQAVVFAGGARWLPPIRFGLARFGLGLTFGLASRGFGLALGRIGLLLGLAFRAFGLPFGRIGL